MKKIHTHDSRKPISLLAAISIGVGGMVGAGIFSILGVAGEVAGNAAYLSFGIAGVVALLCTYSYAKLGARYPSAGGPVEFLVRGLGDNVLSGGFNVLLWIGYIFGLALYARAFGEYASTFLSQSAPQIWVNVFATGIIVLFTVINFIGAKAVGRSELFIVVVKVIILVAFAAIGVFFIKPVQLAVSNWPSSINIFYCAAIVFLAYEGFGLIVNAAEDMQNPRKMLPRALYSSVIIVIFIYVSVSLTVLGNLSVPQIVAAKDYALAEAARPFLGNVGFKIIAVAALFSTSSAINATLYGAANVSYMIAKEGQLPRFFDRKIWQRGTEGLVITAVLVILVANAFQLGGIAMLGSAAFLLIYSAVNVAHLKLYKETGAKPLVIWLSIFGCMTSFVVLVYYEIKHSITTLIVLGAVIAFSFLAEWVYRSITHRKLKTRS
jgi:amino acid transporter